MGDGQKNYFSVCRFTDSNGLNLVERLTTRTIVPNKLLECFQNFSAFKLETRANERNKQAILHGLRGVIIIDWGVG